MGTNKRGGVAKWVRAAVAAIVAMVAVVWFAGGERGDFGDARHASDAWGNESLQSLRAGLRQVSPIALANACGMGASSCFKCHNGSRAAAPVMDPAKAPWHAHHKTVNNSCVGCHQGNARLMKAELAHAGMIKAPKEGSQACGTCHKSDLAKVEAAYKSVGGGK